MNQLQAFINTTHAAPHAAGEYDCGDSDGRDCQGINQVTEFTSTTERKLVAKMNQCKSFYEFNELKRLACVVLR
jgi:hypothetical protein